jgi:hypothetical protein
MKIKATIFLCSLLCLVFLSGCAQKEATQQLAPKQKNALSARTSSEAAVGWSKNDDYKVAISEAVSSAKNGLEGKTANFAHVIYISNTNHEAIIDEIRTQIGPGVKIYGITSNIIITNDRLIETDKFAIGVLLSASTDTVYGMGTIDLEQASSPEEAGRKTIQDAISDAGKELSEKPDMVLYMGTTKRGEENQILDGIAEIIGADVPVIGGNAKDFGPTFTNNWRQFTEDKTYSTGLILVAIYANNVGWGFDSTFKLTDKRATVTESDGFRISQIDGRPALDVYDEWVGGEFYKRLKAGEFNSDEEEVDFALVKIFTLSNPIAKIVRGSGGQIGHFATSPIPDAQDIKNKTITVYAQIVKGDEISLYRGNWQTAMNRVENIPQDALLRSTLKKGEGDFAVMAFCNGLKTLLPSEEFAKIPSITDEVLGGVPFLGAITAGEQGPLPGIRNVNANIIESVVLIH